MNKDTTRIRQDDQKSKKSPDDLQKYLRISSPSMWLVVLALLLVALSAAVWCFWGRIPQLSVGTGICAEQRCVCFFPARDGYALREGMTVRLDQGGAQKEGTIISIGEAALGEDAGATAGAAWLSMPAQWVSPVEVETDGTLPEQCELRAEVLLGEESVISVLMGR